MRVGAAVVINSHFQNGETTCHWSTLTFSSWFKPSGMDVAVHGQDLLPRETNTGTTQEIPALNQSWGGRDHLTSIWPYQGHQVSYLVPRTTGCLSPLWSNIDHMLLECAVLQDCRHKYYTADSLNTLFGTIPETCIVKFLRGVGFYLIWMVRHSIKFITLITPDLMEFVNFN